MIVLLEIDEVKKMLQIVAPMVDPDNPDPFAGADTPTCQACSSLLQAMQHPDQMVPDEIEVLLHDEITMELAAFVIRHLSRAFSPSIVCGKIHDITVFDGRGTLAIYLSLE